MRTNSLLCSFAVTMILFAGKLTSVDLLLLFFVNISETECKVNIVF